MAEQVLPNNHQEIVQLKEARKVYHMGMQEVNALAGVTISFKKGSFWAIMGPSGSGKSTMMNILGCLDRLTSGQYYIEGQDVSQLDDDSLSELRLKHLGFIFQSYYLVPTLSALQNVLMPVLPVKGSDRYYRRAERLLKMMGLKGRMHHKPGELSGGEQQRVAIARALILNPGVILADEPTGNLDSKTGAEIIQLMHWLNKKRGKTFIIVTHDRRIADSAERALYLRDGRLSRIPIEADG